MGYVCHNAIVVTGWGPGTVEEVHRRVKELATDYQYVTELSPEGANSDRSFMVCPDGSYEGWEDSDAGDAGRDRIVEYLRESGADWVEVLYGDQEGACFVVRHADDDERRP